MKLGLRSLLGRFSSFVAAAGLALGCGGAGNASALFAGSDASASLDAAVGSTAPPSAEDASSTDATLVVSDSGPGAAEAGDAGTGGGDAGCSTDPTSACAGKCGELKDACGRPVDCGTCGVGQTCGGSGTPNVCGPGACTSSCTGKACGDSDGCGGICVHGTCAQGQACVAGTCTCDPTTCTGCCEGTACRTGTDPGACGSAGAVCQACPSGDSCPAGACKACAPSCAGKACGANDGCGGTCTTGTCGSGLHCASGSCVCDATSCTGCCAGSACLAGTSSGDCGKGGATCASCASPSTCGGGGQKGACGCTPSCTGKACGQSDGCGGTCDTCASGQRCSSGACVCDATSCPNGCCSGNVCEPSSQTTCGSAGGTCSSCSSQQSCVSGSCIDATLLWSPPGGFGFGTVQRMLAIDPSGQNLYAIDQNNSTTNMMIYRVPTSGAPAQVFASGLNWVVGVTVDSSNVYWLSTGDNTVYAQPVSGGKPRALATGQYFPSDIAVLDSSTVYWGACDSTGSTCDAWQMPVSGGSPTEVASAEPEGIAVASPNLFLAFPVGAGIIQSFPINSGGANVEFDSGNLFYGVAASPLYVAWYGVSTGSSGNNGVVRAMPSASLGVTGSTPTTLAVGQAPVSIALDSSYVYWANTGGSQAFNGSIVKAPLGGGSPTTLVSGVDPASIVVDAKYVYWLGSDGAASGVFRTPK